MGSKRRRPWLVEELRGEGSDLQTLGLSCISNDAQGERLEVIRDAEIGATLRDAQLGSMIWFSISTSFGRFMVGRGQRGPVEPGARQELHAAASRRAWMR